MFLKGGQRNGGGGSSQLPNYISTQGCEGNRLMSSQKLRCGEECSEGIALQFCFALFQNLIQHDPTFPLVDSNAQSQIRKRIVLEKLSKVLPALLGPLQITLGDIYTQLKNLVRTFRLTNRNIIHKPAEWTLIAMVLLSLLAPILGIEKHSRENVFTQFLATLLSELDLKNEDLESLTIIFRTSCQPKCFLVRNLGKVSCGASGLSSFLKMQLSCPQGHSGRLQTSPGDL
ncbi:putative RNA polymerase II subunit B1 CTD phosphatase RPAP2 [Ochotona princeps]|uniref:putative RNA polymerase II subunit B1 CTD phosphatase RPAP2 n=1 Tax=Ochotona princeps TaxID=9978 RepID=UPI002715607B|nr:putative RNA polymerase II subunit B1 CTD phosphatase RPAP2 [Ochotona princeps]